MQKHVGKFVSQNLYYFDALKYLFHCDDHFVILMHIFFACFLEGKELREGERVYY